MWLQYYIGFFTEILSDESSVLLKPLAMKRQKQNFVIALLLMLLAWSIVLNWLQGNQVSRLMKEMEEMEYTQSVLSSHIEELERMEGEEYGNE